MNFSSTWSLGRAADQQFYPVIEDRAGYERYVGVIAEVGARDHVPLFSRYALMRQWDAASPRALPAMLSADRFHVSDRGYACLAQPLARDLARYLEGASIPVGRLAPKPAAAKSR